MKVQGWFKVYLINFLRDFFYIIFISFVLSYAFFYFTNYYAFHEKVIPNNKYLYDGWNNYYNEKSFPARGIYQLVDNELENKVWANTASGLLVYENNSWSRCTEFNKKLYYLTANKIIIDNSGDTWVIQDRKRDALVTAFGLWKFIKDDFKYVREGTFEVITNAADKGVWTFDRWGSRDTLICFPNENESVNLKAHNIPIGFGICGLATDDQGNVWFFSDDSFGKIGENGIVFFVDDDDEFVNYPGKILNVNLEVFAFGDGQIFIQVDQRSVYFFGANKRWTKYSNCFDAIKENSEIIINENNTLPNANDLFSITSEGIILCKNKILKDNEWIVVPQLKEISLLDIKTILPRKNGEVLYGTVSNGLYVCESTNKLISTNKIN